MILLMKAMLSRLFSLLAEHQLHLNTTETLSVKLLQHLREKNKKPGYQIINAHSYATLLFLFFMRFTQSVPSYIQTLGVLQREA